MGAWRIRAMVRHILNQVSNLFRSPRRSIWYACVAALSSALLPCVMHHEVRCTVDVLIRDHYASLRIAQNGQSRLKHCLMTSMPRLTNTLTGLGLTCLSLCKIWPVYKYICS